jgi:internalin A
MTPEAQAAYEEALKRIEECRKLGSKGIRLELNDIGLTELPPEVSQLTSLQKMFLHGNKLAALPIEIVALAALQDIWLHKNAIRCLPSVIGKLTSLRRLYLTGNNLSSLPPEIGTLSNLEQLLIDQNILSELPAEIGQLEQLQNLNVNRNRLRALPKEIGQLRNLRVLSLSDNCLESLPESIAQLESLDQLNLHGNPQLGLPPQILGPRTDQGQSGDDDVEMHPAKPADIIDYYFGSRGTAGRVLREAKVILVGRGGVGKTSLVRALSGAPFSRISPTTDGIVINKLPVLLADGAAELAIWDFGGQEIMHGTHQFFLTHRSLYLIVVSGRNDQGRQDAEYWLKLIRAFGGQSPAMLVMNKQGECPFDIDREALSQKYGIAPDHFFQTDCVDGESVEPLRQAIFSEVEQMLAAEERFPASFWEIKTRLGHMKSMGEDYLSSQDYDKLCVEYGVIEHTEQQKLLQRLSDLGTVVSFPYDVRLSALTVLNPEWATDSIYRIVSNSNAAASNGGILTRAKIRELLPKDRWPSPLHVKYVLDLMQKFDLCFPVDGDAGSILVPDLLPDRTPPLGDWDAKQAVVLEFHYTVLPHGVLPRFITRTNHLSSSRPRWRSGVELALGSASARVQADYDANTLNVWVRGQEPLGRRQLLELIQKEFCLIHSRIEGLSPKEMVSIPKYAGVFLNLRDLRVMQDRGLDTYLVVVENSLLEVPIVEVIEAGFDLSKPPSLFRVESQLFPDVKIINEEG